MSNRIIPIMQVLLLLGSSQQGFAATALAYVDDGVLAQLRGRYVSAGEIVQFGIQMITIWHDGNNGTTGIAKTLTSNTKGDATLTGYTLNNGSNSTGNSGLLSSAKGVVQLNQLAGQQNRALNDVQIEINSTHSSTGSLSGSWQQQTQSAVSGKPDMSIRLNQGNTGQAGQSLAQGQLMQYATLNGNHVSTTNTLRLQLWLQQPGNLAASLPARSLMGGLGNH